jgi:hypothetical protein
MKNLALLKNSTALKPLATAPNKFKKRKGFFLFLNLLARYISPRHIGRMSGALCDFDEC